MGDSEKLMELKKAYAEIILNTSKEAAARVIMAEKKAFRYQRELAEVKEDAVRMMIRLKQMMDSRIHEADAVALHQKSKIDELEAQLHEAEDIVNDLREELAIVKDELHDMRKKRTHQMGEQQAYHIVIKRQKEQGEEIAPSFTDYNLVSNGQATEVAISELGKVATQGISEITRDDPHETVQISDLDMAPNVIMVKGPELLRNGSSQGNGELANENFNNDDDIHRKSLFVMNNSTVKEGCESSGKSVTQISSAEVNVSEESNSRVKQAKKRNTKYNIKAYNRRIKKSKSSSLRKRRSIAKMIPKSLKKTNLMTSETDPFTVVPTALKKNDSQGEVALSINTVELCSKTGLCGKNLPCRQSTPESDKSNMRKASTGEENGSTESSVTFTNPEIPCAPSCSIIEKSDDLDADDALQPKQDKPIQVTFQRKRNKECMDSADENNIVVVKRSLGEETLCRPTTVEYNADVSFAGPPQQSDNKENTLQEIKRSMKRVKIDRQDLKTSLKPLDVEMPTATEPKTIGIAPKATQDSRRRAQVARQLLSISEKKWWD